MLVATKIIHIAFAAAWFGHKLLIPRDVRVSVHEREARMAMVGRIQRAQRLGIISGVGTVLTGVGLILLTTGFADAPVRIYFGLAAALGIFVIGALVARPAWADIASGIESDDVPRAAAAVKPFSSALVIENFLWIVALGSMVV